MDILKDEIYDNLDWLSQVTQPVMSSTLDRVDCFKDKTVLSYDEIVMLFIKSNVWNASLSDAINHFDTTKDISNEPLDNKYFAFEASDNFQINLDTKEVTGELSLIKKHNIDENKIIKNVVNDTNDILDDLRYLHYNGDAPKAVMKRLKTTIKLFSNNPQHWKSTSFKRLTTTLKRLLHKDVLCEKSKIKNLDLKIKYANWVCDYVENGNLSAHANIHKLKSMFDISDNPIYSIVETT